MNNPFILTADTSNSIQQNLEELTFVSNASVNNLNKVALFKKLIECSMNAGGYVRFSPEIGYLPALIDSNAKPVYLYQLIELIDELLDYDQIKEEYPTLSYAQIGGAMAFLRKIAQLNTKEVEIDELEDEFISENSELVGELRQALADMEIVNVFSEI